MFGELKTDKNSSIQNSSVGFMEVEMNGMEFTCMIKMQNILSTEFEISGKIVILRI